MGTKNGFIKLLKTIKHKYNKTILTGIKTNIHVDINDVQIRNAGNYEKTCNKHNYSKNIADDLMIECESIVHVIQI